MREFFKGWQRKLGCIFLLMALAVMGAWIRSEHIYDICFWLREKSAHTQYSTLGHFFWRSEFYEAPIDPSTRVSWKWQSLSGQDGRYLLDQYSSIGFKWGWSFGGLQCSKYEVAGGTHYWLIIPYWMVAVPLTLLSAWLILWKARAKQQLRGTSGMTAS